MIEDIAKNNKKSLIVISLIGLVLYFKSLFFGFTYFDDNVLVLDNFFFLKDLSNFFRSFTMEVFHVLHSSAAYYRPILTISYMFDAQFGSGPFVFHLSSVVVHIAVCCLLFIFLKRLKISASTSFVLTMLYMVHPVLTQAVSWIPGRNDSLLGLFILPAFIFLIDFFEKHELKYYLLHMACFFLAIFTKESAVFIPVLAVFLILTLYRKGKVFEKLVTYGMGWFFILLLWFFLRSIALSGNPMQYDFSNVYSSITNNLPAILLYLGKVLFPFNLNVLPTLQDSTLVYGIIALVLILIAIFSSKTKKYTLILLGTFWFLAFLVPAFIRPDSSYVADFLEHRIYVPLMGLLIVFSEISFVKNLDLNKKLTKTVLLAIFVLLVVINFIHNNNFKDKIAFWENAVKYSPSHPLSHKNLGAMYYLDGNLGAAKIEFEKSVAINPTEAMIHNNLGLIYYREGNYEKAEEEYFRELELYPNYDNAYMNLGLLYYQEGDKDKAAEMWFKTIQVNPDHKDALKSLTIYYSQDKKDQAKANYYYQEAVKRGVKF